MAEKVRTNAAGFLEGYDDETGQILWAEKRKTVVKDGKLEKASSPGRGRPKKDDRDTHHYVTDGRGEKLWVPKGTNPDNLPRTVWPFNQTTCDLICQKITEGESISAIGRTEGFPPSSTIHAWARKYPEFKREMREAVEARATYYADMAMDIGLSTTKDTIMEDRLKTEMLKWGAEVGDRATYGKATKITGDPNSPVTFLIDTGVRRLEDES